MARTSTAERRTSRVADPAAGSSVESSGDQRTRELILAEAQQALRERVARHEALIQRGGLYLALCAALVGLAAVLPAGAGVAAAMFALLAAYWSLQVASLRRPEGYDARTLAATYADEPADVVGRVLTDAALEQTDAVDRVIADKTWCVETAELFLVCAMLSTAAGVVAAALL